MGMMTNISLRRQPPAMPAVPPDPRERERMISEYIALHGVTRIERIEAPVEPLKSRKKHVAERVRPNDTVTPFERRMVQEYIDDPNATIETIAAKFGVQEHVMRKAMADCGVKKKARVRVPTETELRAVEQCRKRMGCVADVAFAFKIRPDRLRSLCKRMGVEITPGCVSGAQKSRQLAEIRARANDPAAASRLAKKANDNQPLQLSLLPS